MLFCSNGYLVPFRSLRTVCSTHTNKKRFETFGIGNSESTSLSSECMQNVLEQCLTPNLILLMIKKIDSWNFKFLSSTLCTTNLVQH